MGAGKHLFPSGRVKCLAGAGNGLISVINHLWEIGEEGKNCLSVHAWKHDW